VLPVREHPDNAVLKLLNPVDTHVSVIRLEVLNKAFDLYFDCILSLLEHGQNLACANFYTKNLASMMPSVH
jgi:hypothetical protein